MEAATSELKAQLIENREEAMKKQKEFEKLSSDLQTQLVNEKKNIADLNKKVEQQKIIVENQNKTILQKNEQIDILIAKMKAITDRKFFKRKEELDGVKMRLRRAVKIPKIHTYSNMPFWNKMPSELRGYLSECDLHIDYNAVWKRINDADVQLDHQYRNNQAELLRNAFNINLILLPKLRGIIKQFPGYNVLDTTRIEEYGANYETNQRLYRFSNSRIVVKGVPAPHGDFDPKRVSNWQ